MDKEIREAARTNDPKLQDLKCRAGEHDWSERQQVTHHFNSKGSHLNADGITLSKDYVVIWKRVCFNCLQIDEYAEKIKGWTGNAIYKPMWGDEL